jgi:hypothetical protein
MIVLFESILRPESDCVVFFGLDVGCGVRDLVLDLRVIIRKAFALLRRVFICVFCMPVVVAMSCCDDDDDDRQCGMEGGEGGGDGAGRPAGVYNE